MTNEINRLFTGKKFECIKKLSETQFAVYFTDGSYILMSTYLRHPERKYVLDIDFQNIT